MRATAQSAPIPYKQHQCYHTGPFSWRSALALPVM